MQVSPETIYRSLFVQSRGVLRRCLLQQLRRQHSVRHARRRSAAPATGPDSRRGVDSRATSRSPWSRCAWALGRRSPWRRGRHVYRDARWLRPSSPMLSRNNQVVGPKCPLRYARSSFAAFSALNWRSAISWKLQQEQTTA